MNEILFTCLLSLAIFPTLEAQTVQARGAPSEAQAFVQHFYDWYAPIAAGEHKEAASNIALRNRPQAFAPELARALKADSDAQAKANEIVGLDFDPFLSGQDPCDRFVTGQVSQRTGSYRVDVFRICEGKKSSSAAVIAEVEQSQGRWVFKNFYYPPNYDLVTELKMLADQRQKYP